MPKAPVANETAGATDSTDAEVIKGPGGAPAQENPPVTAAPTGPGALTTAASLEKGEPVTGAGGPASTATPGSLGSVSAQSPSTQPAGSSTTPSSASEKGVGQPSLTVHSIVSTQVGTVTQDADTAMHNLRGDVSNLHKLLSNATHYATLPVAEVEKLIARASVLLGVIRSKL